MRHGIALRSAAAAATLRGRPKANPAVTTGPRSPIPLGRKVDYVICGWRVRSALPLPEAPRWRGHDKALDIEIEYGPVPKRGGRRLPNLPYLEAVRGSAFIFDRAPYARFLVSRNRVVVDDSLPLEKSEWRGYLLGPVLGLLCYLRRLLPLHASAIRIGDRVIALAGHSGAGKSTLAAALVARGHFLVADDVCALTSSASHTLVLPSHGGLKLSLASLELLGIDATGLERIHEEKFQVLRTEQFDPTAAPLDRVYLLEDAPEGRRAAILPLRGAQAFEQLSAEIYRPEIGRRLLPKSRFFAAAADVARRIQVRRLSRRLNSTGLEALIGLIETDVGNGW